MKNFIILIAVFFVLILVPALVFGQPPSFPENPPQVPIDGGLGLLAAAGGAYAVSKLRRKKSNT